MRLFVFLVSGMLWMPAISAQASTKITASIVEYGLYYTGTDGTAPASKTSTGEITLLTNPRLVRTTTTIPARPRTSFGIRYRIDSVSEEDTVAVTDVVITPGLRNPENNIELTRIEAKNDVVRGSRDIYTGYTFDQPWEAVPGEWKIEVWFGNKKLVSQTFEVVPAMRLAN